MVSWTPILLFCRLVILAIMVLGLSSPALADDLGDKINALADGKFKERAIAVGALAETGDPRVVPALEALSAGLLYTQKAGGKVVIVEKQGRSFQQTDPLTGDDLGIVGKSALKKIRVNNSLRRTIRSALGGLMLQSPNDDDRKLAAEKVFKSKDADAIPLLDKALAKEQIEDVAIAMREARAVALLNSKEPDDLKLEAIGTLKARGDRDARSILLAFVNQADGTLKQEAEAAITEIDHTLAMWSAVQNVWYGLSLGSVLLLAAIGLAITFGVMGVINMAHGEMVMIGAYTTFVVQEAIRMHFPGLFDMSLFIAVPLAFLVSGAVGVAIERGVIRWLYGRPLETLLATWGISLVLQQAVRSIFGPTNQEVGTPDFMSGAFEIGQMTITYNRLYILIFALLVLFILMLVMKKTHYGLQMRAVTQNRKMAGAMGIKTDWVDAMTFGLGSGIAGIAGVALSQIDNVSPNLGQAYIIDSFMVVVFGGVGNLWGTLVGAMSLGIINKFLEPYAGAVLAKIIVLVAIILFIQKRPRGMFALKGRAIEQ